MIKKYAGNIVQKEEALPAQGSACNSSASYHLVGQNRSARLYASDIISPFLAGRCVGVDNITALHTFFDNLVYANLVSVNIS
jgi:hypothetical protein